VATFFTAKEEALSSGELEDVKKDIQKQKDLLEKHKIARETKGSRCPTLAFAAPPLLGTRAGEIPLDECREAPAKRIYSQADLRNAIHADVNGDLEFATKCYDCFDFAALTVSHAVAVFLGKGATLDQNLHVFAIFQEVICEKV
jgi:hypothetical protein